jgi:hypothetical protein
MDLVSEMLFAVMLCPLCIGVFLAAFLIRSFFRHFSFLYLFVLIPRVPLDGNLHDGGIHHLPGVHDDTVFAQLPVKKFEKHLHNARLGKAVSIQPYCLGIRHPFMDSHTKETHETEAVEYGVLCIVVADILVALQVQDLEHQHLVVAGSPSPGGFLSQKPSEQTMAYRKTRSTCERITSQWDRSSERGSSA